MDRKKRRAKVRLVKQMLAQFRPVFAAAAADLRSGRSREEVAESFERALEDIDEVLSSQQ